MLKHNPDLPALSAFHPSEYTAALIQVLRIKAATIQGAHVFELGVGSGVLLAALGALGAATLSGVDIEIEAIESSVLLLRGLGYGDAVQLYRGHLWQPVVGQRFDVITANLPHFPTEHMEIAGRLPTWSKGGHDGRSLLDPFLEGLAEHLAPGGRAFITHNAFVDLALSRAIVERAGLSLRIAMTTLIYIPDEKLRWITQSILSAEQGRSIFRYGTHTFAELYIVEIGTPGTLNEDASL